MGLHTVDMDNLSELLPFCLEALGLIQKNSTSSLTMICYIYLVGKCSLDKSHFTTRRFILNTISEKAIFNFPNVSDKEKWFPVLIKCILTSWHVSPWLHHSSLKITCEVVRDREEEVMYLLSAYYIRGNIFSVISSSLRLLFNIFNFIMKTERLNGCFSSISYGYLDLRSPDSQVYETFLRLLWYFLVYLTGS